MRQHPTQGPRRSGFSLIESVMAMVILSGAMAAAINTVASARAGQVMAEERARCRVLAESMLQEALSQPYAEPGSSTLGTDSGEAGSTTRAAFDDADDYAGWQGAPSTPDGTPQAGFEDYIMTYQVTWIDPALLTQPSSSDRGLKFVVVTITRNEKTVAELGGWSVRP